MGVLQTAYPQFYRGMKKDQAENTIALWSEMFANDPAEAVSMAVKSFISTDTKGFPPSIGIIKDHVLKVTAPPQKSALEAWAEVKRALKNSSYGYVEEFGKLDSATQRIVGSALQLREWAQMNTDTLDSVIGSNFRESYGAVSRRQRNQAVLPPAISELVAALAGKMDMKQETLEPRALPISVTAEVEKIKREIGEMPKREMPKPLSTEEFEKRKAELLREIGA